MGELAAYPTWAEVDLSAIRANLHGVRASVGPQRKVLFAVKADAYGHGAVPVARMAQRSGCADWLGVATVAEGIELRDAGITVPILKFSPVFADEAQAAVAADLRLTVTGEADADLAQHAAATTGRMAQVHLKVDTGMGRIGATSHDAAGVARHIDRGCPGLHLEGIFTHLPVADDPAQDDVTRDQLARFADTVRETETAIGRRIELVHAANSGGVLAHPASWLTMVRPGIMAYGSYPDPATPRTVALTPALSWCTRVSFVKHVTAGVTIGYGRTWTAPRDTWIATLPVGYGDGYPRALSNRGIVLIAGRAYPIVGRVCMDQSMVDLGPQTNTRLGDRVTLLGRNGDVTYTAEDMAATLGTIPYEITCQIGRRVPRRYTGG